VKFTDRIYIYIPLYSFVFTWITAFILKATAQMELYNVSIETYIIIISSIISFVLGYLYKSFFSEDIHKKRKQKQIQIDYKFVFIVLLITIIIYCISFYYHISILSEERGGWIKYIINPIMARQAVVEAGKLSSWNIGLALSSYGVALITVIGIMGGVLFTSKNKFYIAFSILPLLLGFVFGLFTFSRYSIIQIIMYWSFAALYFSYFQNKELRSKTIKRLGIALGFQVMLFIGLVYIIVNLRYFTESNKDIANTFQEQFTYYIIGNIVGLERYFDESPPLLYGKRLFNPIEKWLNRINVLNDTHPLEFRFNFTRTSNTEHINTFSFIRPLHEDFGTVALLILSFIWGYIGLYFLLSLLDSFSFIRFYIVIVFCFSVTMSFFGLSFLNYTKVLYEIFLFWLINKSFFQRQKLQIPKV